MYNLYVSNLWFCYLFCLCLSFTIKVKKRYLLFEKEVRYFQLSSEWYFDVNIVRSSSISHFTKRCFKAQKRYLFSVSSNLMKGTKRYLFCSWKRCSQKREKGTFLAVGSDVLKSAKKVPLIVFSSHGKPFRILLIDRCQPFGVILWIFLSQFTNPLVKR